MNVMRRLKAESIVIYARERFTVLKFYSTKNVEVSGYE